MNNIKSLALIITTLFVISCSQYDAIEYKNDPGIYFAKESITITYSQADSISHSFFSLVDKTRDTVYVYVRTMGYLSDVDRPIKLIQTNTGDADAAIAGVHYVAFDDASIADKYVIPANKEIAKIPIVLLRDNSLDTKVVRLNIEVANNEHFKQGIDELRRFLLKTTAQASKPTRWDNLWMYYFGASWGTEKMKFIIQHTGYTDWEVIPSDGAYIGYMSSKVQNAFQQYNLENPNKPLIEADGTLVSFTS